MGRIRPSTASSFPLITSFVLRSQALVSRPGCSPTTPDGILGLENKGPQNWLKMTETHSLTQQ